MCENGSDGDLLLAGDAMALRRSPRLLIFGGGQLLSHTGKTRKNSPADPRSVDNWGLCFSIYVCHLAMAGAGIVRSRFQLFSIASFAPTNGGEGITFPLHPLQS